MSDRSAKEENRLFDAACSGRLDEVSRFELQQRLRESPSARERYLDYTAVHADLFGAVRTARVHDHLVDLLGEESQTKVSHPSRVLLRGSIVALTALATAAALLLMLIPRSQQPVAEDDVATASFEGGYAAFPGEEDRVRWPGLIARINRIEAVAWENDGDAIAESELIAAGRSVEISSGRVEIEFRQGAVVLLEGPAHLIAEEANAASLLHGKLAAVAPPWATGFRIDTPGVDVVDHGTEFAVSVSDNGKGPQVNVVVTEGEVEVLADQQMEGGRRLRAGEGVQSSGAAVEVGDDVAARRLTEHLPNRPELKNAVVVGDRWGDWAVGSDGKPCRNGAWRYYTNETAEFGDPTSYEELVWDASEECYRPASRGKKPVLGKYVRVHREGGHPGKGRDQVGDGIDRYSITGFVVPEDGVYRIEAGWLERLWAKRWDRDQVLDIALHVNDGPIVMTDFCNRDCFVSFRHGLGELTAGDTIYLGVGPSGADFNDRFRWGFYIVRETDAAAEGHEPSDANLALTD